MSQIPRCIVIARRTVLIAAFASVWTGLMPSTTAAESPRHDVVIYGGTSAGIAAAVQVRRMGGSVVVIEPSSRIGGLTTGGLGQTDIGNKAAIGGVAREFYRRVRRLEKSSACRWAGFGLDRIHAMTGQAP